MPIFPVQDIGTVQPVSAQNLVGSLEAVQNSRSNRALTDTRNDMLQFNLQNAPDQLARANQQQDLQMTDEWNKRFIIAGSRLLRFLAQEKPDTDGALRFAHGWKQLLTDNGITAQQDVDLAIDALTSEDPQKMDQLAQGLVSLHQHGMEIGVLKGGQGEPEKSAGQREFEALIADFSDDDQVRSRRVKAGLEPRAVGSANQTITNEGTAGAIAETVGTIEEGKKTGSLTAELALKPVVESAVTTAVAEANLIADEAKLTNSNTRTFDVYNTGMQGLVSALDNTATGPFRGLIPAVTTNQQISDGAIAAMAPVMKQMFRAAGEGIFTDKDQELLLQMIPDRRDTAEARKAKLTNIDAIVRAKLGIGEDAVSGPQDVPGFNELSPEEQQEFITLWNQQNGN